MVLALNSVSDAMVVVTTPEPHALTDAYAVIKVMSEEYDRGVCGLIINQVRSDDESMRISERLVEVARQYCGVRVIPVGGVRNDSVLARSIMARRVGWDGALNTLAGQGWSSSWRKLYESINKGAFGERSRPLSDVWTALSGKHENASNA
jgi:flagellar biosynthesis protein FlhG